VEGSSSREVVSEERTVLLTGRHAADSREVVAYVGGEEHGGLLIAGPYEGGLDARTAGGTRVCVWGRLEHRTTVWVGELTGRRWRRGWLASSEDGVVGGAGAGLR
jgi:hypothetical protein